TKQTNAAMAKQNATKGTWTFVNEARSLGNDMNSRLVGSGTITFNEGRFVQNDHQHQEGAYSVDWLSQMLNLDYFKDGNPWFNVNLIFKSIGPNSIKLQDYHGDIIQLRAEPTSVIKGNIMLQEASQRNSSVQVYVGGKFTLETNWKLKKIFTELAQQPKIE